MARDISSIRIRRLLNLLVYLRKKGEYGAKVGDILASCEYSNRRALQEDIRLLRDEYHAEITYKRSVPPRYCLTYEGEFLLSLSLNIKDITALSLGLGMASHFLPDFREHCRDLWHKIANLVPDAFIDMGEWLANAVTMQYPVSGIKPLVFEMIIEAIHDHEVMEIDYISPYKDRQARTHMISPYDMFFKAHSWYMTAGCGDRVLMFKLSRIQRISVIHDGEYVMPPDDYNPAEVRESSWYLRYGDLKHNIRLIVREPMASIVSETIRHPTQRISRIDDNTVELTATIPDLDEAARWILSCSPYIVVEEPQELMDKVCVLAQKAILAQENINS